MVLPEDGRMIIKTYLQLFGIGFGFGLAGPCLLVCTPVLAAYIAGRQAAWKRTLSDILIFLVGRLFAYLILGYLAGLSGVVLRQFCSSKFIIFVNALGGVIIVLLGIYVWVGKEPFRLFGKCGAGTIFSSGSLFMLGFTMGVLPCAPLLALLLEIALISKTALSGIVYALFFGLGTLVSGFIVITALSGTLAWLPAKILKSKKSNLIFRTICALLLMWLGLNTIFCKTEIVN
jgi:thiol:disulfide interchange protein DsbD